MTSNETIDKIMYQAQVFASAWELVGTRFDEGGMLDRSNLEKDKLELLIRRECQRGQGNRLACLPAILDKDE